MPLAAAYIISKDRSEQSIRSAAEKEGSMANNGAYTGNNYGGYNGNGGYNGGRGGFGSRQGGGRISFRILEHIGVISVNENTWRKEVNVVSWNGGKAKLDIREWSPNHDKMSRGLTFHENDAVRLGEILAWRFGINGQEVGNPAADIYDDYAYDPEQFGRGAANNADTGMRNAGSGDDLPSDPLGNGADPCNFDAGHFECKAASVVDDLPGFPEEGEGRPVHEKPGTGDMTHEVPEGGELYGDCEEEYRSEDDAETPF